MAIFTVYPGDLAEYRGRGEPKRCEVLGHSPKRVRVLMRVGGQPVVRLVAAKNLKTVGGGY